VLGGRALVVARLLLEIDAALAGGTRAGAARRGGRGEGGPGRGGGGRGGGHGAEVEAAGGVAVRRDGLAERLGVLLDATELELHAIGGRLAKVLGNVCKKGGSVSTKQSSPKPRGLKNAMQE